MNIVFLIFIMCVCSAFSLFFCNTNICILPDLNIHKHLNLNSQEIKEMGYNKFCSSCEFSTRNMTVMRLHLWDEHQQITAPPICCQHCLFQCRTKYTLQQHVFRKHNFGQMPIDCPYCKFKSLSILEVENHIQVKHRKEKKRFSCPHCEVKSSSRGNLNYHINAHHIKKMNFFCHFCDYKCILPGNMKRHLLKIHNKSRSNLSTFSVPLLKNVSDVKNKSS